MVKLLSKVGISTFSTSFYFAMSLLVTSLSSGVISTVSTSPISLSPQPPVPQPVPIATIPSLSSSAELKLDPSSTTTTKSTTTTGSYYPNRSYLTPSTRTNREEDRISTSTRKVVVLTNVKRQIGNSSRNPISNLHEKVNGQGERGGGQGLNVTDVSSSLEFTTTRNTTTNTKKMIPIPNSIPVDRILTTVISASSSSSIDATEELRRRSLSLLSPLLLGSVPRRKKSLFDNVTKRNEQIDMGHSENANSTRTANKTFAIRWERGEATVKKGGVGNVDVEARVNRNLIRNRHKRRADIISNGVNNDLHTKSKNNDNSGRLKVTSRAGAGSGGEDYGDDANKVILVRSGGTIGTKGVEDLKGQGKSCRFVIVNQTLSLNFNITDMDKWTRTLVKISQCVANCLQKTQDLWNHRNNMSPKKDMNRMGGTSFPHGISPTRLLLPSTSNQDTVNPPYFPKGRKNYLNDKLLSTCQKRCKFYPQRKSTYTEMTDILKKKVLKMKLNSTEKEESLRTSTSKKNPISKPIPIAIKADDPSLGLEIRGSDTTGIFHLRWLPLLPKRNKRIPVVYTVILEEKLDYEDDDEEGRKGQGVGRWKLIDQTVAQQTQISLETEVCQNPGGLNKKRKPGGLLKHQIDPQYRNHHTIRVLAVSSDGLEKLFSGLLISTPCCQQEVRPNHPKNFSSENEQRQPSTLFNVTNTNSNKVTSQPSHTSRNSFDDTSKMENVKGGENTSQVVLELNEAEDDFSKNRSSNNKDHHEEPCASTPSPSSSPPEPSTEFWGLRTSSMVYENYLVVTEVAWNFPAEAEKSVVSMDNDDDDRSADVRFSPKSQTERDGNNPQKYNFLLTWEIFGGGLKGNLVTDTTSGTISLWPDTAYYIQVGLINTENPDLSLSPLTSSPSSKTNKLKKGVKEEKNDANSLEGQKSLNYVHNPEEIESIIFPLLSEDGEPKVSVKSERLFVNTSQISIPRLSSQSSSSSPPSSSSSSFKSQRTYNGSGGSSSSSSNRNGINDTTGSRRRTSKSNNPPLPQEEGEPEKSFYLSKTNVSSIPSLNSNASAIVSKNGNEDEDRSQKANYNVGSSPLISIGKNGQSQNDVESKSPHHHHYEKDQRKKDHNHYHHYPFEGYLGDSPQSKQGSMGYDGYYEREGVHSYHNNLIKKLTQAESQPASSTFTPGPNGYEDKKSNINNNNKSNNNLKPRPGTDHDRGGEHDHHAEYRLGSIFRPDVYRDLFALNFGNGYSDGGGGSKSGGPSALTTGSEHSNRDSNNNNNNNVQFDFSNKNDSFATPVGLGFDITGDEETPSSPIYSVFVLIIVACVIFLFLVAFIGFFVVTSSIAKTAQYFVPKRVRIWVVGGDSTGGQSGLFGGDEEVLVEEDEDDDDEEEDELGGLGNHHHRNHHQHIMGELEDIDDHRVHCTHDTNSCCNGCSNWNGIPMNASLEADRV